MGRRIIQQPDGKFAVFSTIVDCFVAIGLSEQEVIAGFVQLATDRALVDANAAIATAKDGGVRTQFDVSWQETVAMHRQNHANATKHVNEAIDAMQAQRQQKGTPP